jgi:anaerobic selenocysteine-containing dehydrogenase
MSTTESKPGSVSETSPSDDPACGLNRRELIQTTALVAGASALAGSLPVFTQLAGSAVSIGPASAVSEYPLNRPENIIYSICLNCHTACSIKSKIQDGVLVKVDGNPYSPMNLLPHVAEATPLAIAAKEDAKLCPKGQAAVQVAYDPYRIRKVLKRVGKRGEGKWTTIGWDQFIGEVVAGGDLFGEGRVDGLDDIYKLRDPAIADALKQDSEAVASGDMTIDDFKQTHAAHLDYLIDPDHPDLGPVNNQFIFMGGRVEHGRKELAKRFTYDGMGSSNFYLHTTICEQSHHIAYKMLSGKSHMKPDYLSSEFVVFFGTGAFEANFGPTPSTEMVTDSMVRNNFKYAVVDPRLSKTAAKAWKWVPVEPGGDSALALGMIRWIIDNERFDAAYLEAPTSEAAAERDEVSWSDATHLVRLDEMVFLVPADAGLDVPLDEAGEPVTGGRVVMSDLGPVLDIETQAGVLTGEFEVNGIAVKPAFQLLADRVAEKSLSEYAEIAGVKESDIVDLAAEFTNHGKKAAAEFYRGPVQHTNGYYNAQAIVLLNVLIGNVNHRGGITTGGSHWHEDGSKPGQPFPKSLVVNAPGGATKWGTHINREGNTYEDSTLFDGYPATRPWYPFTSELYQNIIPSAAAGYPYKAKALLIQKGTPLFASPAGHAQIEMLRDSSKIPLVISCDIVIGETSMYADYIMPDLSFMERWGVSHTTPGILTKMSKIRQPTMAPLTDTVVVDGESMPISLEAFFLAAGKALGLAGFGKDGFGEGFDFDRPEQYYLAMASNLAFGDKEDGSEVLPEADAEEMRIFSTARSHLPATVFDEETWRAAVPSELWPSVVYLLNRGGRFADASETYEDDEFIKAKWKGRWNLYVEKVANGRDSITGENFDGLPSWQPTKDAAGNEVTDEGYDLTLITHKEITGGQSRTSSAPWLQRAIAPENYILMNTADARARGFGDGDKAEIVSATLPDGRFELGDGRTYVVDGKIKAIEGMRPGTVSVSWTFGHWAYGSNDVEIDGNKIRGDATRGTGTVPNPAMRLDGYLGDVCMTDPIGGSASFYDTKVRVEPAR